jgi:hypothetical protein
MKCLLAFVFVFVACLPATAQVLEGRISREAYSNGTMVADEIAVGAPDFARQGSRAEVPAYFGSGLHRKDTLRFWVDLGNGPVPVWY